MAVELWIPESAREPRRTVLRCNVCEREFPMEQRQQWKRHVVACARKNEDRIEGQLAALDRSSFTSTKHNDEEQLQWWRKRVAEGGKPPTKPLIGL